MGKRLWVKSAQDPTDDGPGEIEVKNHFKGQGRQLTLGRVRQGNAHPLYYFNERGDVSFTDVIDNFVVYMIVVMGYQITESRNLLPFDLGIIQ
jgi:hypothetical protein